MIDWEEEVKTRENLLVARIRQLDQRALDGARPAENLERSRKEIAAHFEKDDALWERILAQTKISVYAWQSGHQRAINASTYGFYTAYPGRIN